MRLNFGALLCLRLSPLQGLIPLNSIARKNVPCSKTFMTVRYPDDPSSDWGEEPGDVDEMMDVTNTLLDSSAAPGSLSGESLDDFFPLMLWWGKQASEDGALAVQKLLSRLDDEIDAGKSAPKPRYKYYTLALDAWGKAGYIEQAESILSRMEDLGRFDATFSPTRVTYNAMMNAYVKQGDVERAARILEAMEETSDLVPIVNDYNTILAGYAKLGCAKKAEYLVQRMISLSREQGSSESVPDVYSYYALLDAWAKSDEPGRGLRAQEILSTLIEKSENGEFEWTPDGRIFSTVITALARSGGSMDQIGQLWSDAVARGLGSDAYVTSALLDANASSGLFDSAESAEKILEKLEKEGLVNGVAYNTVLKAWKINGGEQAVASAEHLFKRMKALGLDDAFSYCTLIALHADQGNRKSAERAEEILLDMKDTTLIPNVETLNAVMNAWTRCGDVESADRVLKYMEEAYHVGGREGGLSPNVVSYTTLMNGWAKSGKPNAVEKTRETFERMKSMYKSGNLQAQPNLVSYVTLINSIVRSNQRGSAQVAEETLHEMYKEYKAGSITVPPNARIVTSVIDCWQKSGERDAGERAERLLDWLLEIYGEERHDSLQPNEYTFNSVISAWARTRKFGKAARAKAILSKMIQLKDAGIISASPNAHCYTAVINSCAYCENDSLDKSLSLRIAIETYKELLNSNHEGPNQITFSTFLTALQNLMPPNEKRAVAIRTIFKRCADDGLVSDLVLRRLQSSLSQDQLRKVLGKTVVSPEGTVNAEQIPLIWRRNVNDLRPRRSARQEA